MGWKDQAAKSVVTSAAPTVSADALIAKALSAKLAAGEIAQKDRSFVTLLLEGFARYHSFTERQRPYAVKFASSEVAQASTPLAVDRSKFVDLAGLAAGRYAVETRRYRVAKPGVNSKWNGWTFVDDGSEYGVGEKYGRQQPGSTILNVTARNAAIVCDDLRVILADPLAASAEYGRITGSCGVCGRVLEDPESVARGIGPVCILKFGA